MVGRAGGGVAEGSQTDAVACHQRASARNGSAPAGGRWRTTQRMMVSGLPRAAILSRRRRVPERATSPSSFGWTSSAEGPSGARNAPHRAAPAASPQTGRIKPGTTDSIGPAVAFGPARQAVSAGRRRMANPPRLPCQSGTSRLPPTRRVMRALRRARPSGTRGTRRSRRVRRRQRVRLADGRSVGGGGAGPNASEACQFRHPVRSCRRLVCQYRQPARTSTGSGTTAAPGRVVLAERLGAMRSNCCGPRQLTSALQNGPGMSASAEAGAASAPTVAPRNRRPTQAQPVRRFIVVRRARRSDASASGDQGHAERRPRRCRVPVAPALRQGWTMLPGDGKASRHPFRSRRSASAGAAQPNGPPSSALPLRAAGAALRQAQASPRCRRDQRNFGTGCAVASNASGASAPSAAGSPVARSAQRSRQQSL